MNKFTKEGLRFIIGMLIVTLTAIVVVSIISTSIKQLTSAIQDYNEIIQKEPEVITPEVITHRIDFNSMGGTTTNVTSITVEEGKFIPSFPATSLEGYIFLGWYTGVTPSDVLFTSSIPIVQDITLYARWVAEPTDPVVEPGDITYRVAFETDGGTPVDSIQVTENDTFVLPFTSREGYEFLGWFTGNLPGDYLVTALSPVTQDLTLYARWQKSSYMITYITNGGSFVSPTIAVADSNITEPANPIKLNQSFSGWYLDESLTELYDFVSMPSENITLFAGWISGTDNGVEYLFTSTESIIIGYDNFNTELVIPALKNGVPVTTIGDYAFKDANHLVSIVFEGNDLISIGKNAFENATALKYFAIPSSVTTIKQNAFKNAASLLSLEISNDVQNIGIGILEGADSIETLTVPFFGTNVNNQPTNLKYYFGGTTYSSSVLLPTSLKTVNVSQGVSVIPNDLFREMNTLVEVNLPDSVISVGTNVLTGTQLKSLTWVFTGSADTQPNTYLSYAFGNAHQAVTNVPSSLNTVNILSNSNVIYSYAFYNIANLTEINLPNNITQINQYAFAHVANTTSQLKQIELPENLVTVGNYVFNNSGKLESLMIPNTVVNLGTFFLSGTANLNTLSLSASSLPTAYVFLRYVFGSTSATSGGTLPTALENVHVTNTTNDVLPLNFFYGFTTIKNVTLPATLTTLGNTVFYNTTSLESVVIPDTLVTLGTGVFQNSGVLSVALPEGLTAIPNDTFNGASRLTNVSLPATLTTIGNSAFLGTKLTSVSLPSAVTTIGSNAFQNMTELTTFNMPSSVTSISTNLLTGNSKLANLTFTIDSLPTTYRFLRYLFGGTAVTTGGTMPAMLKQVTLNSNAVTLLPTSFFNAFTTVETIILSDTFTTMGANVFYNNSALKNVSLPNALTNIGDYAFYGTTSLTNLNVPSTVTTVGQFAFQLSGITQLAFVGTLTSIGNSAFTQTASLIQLYFYQEVPPTLGTTVFGATPSTTLFILVVDSADDVVLNAYIAVPQFATFNTNGKLLTFTPEA